MTNSIYIQTVDSTNDFLKQLVIAKEHPEGFVVYTDFQTVGKGQKGNTWEAEKGKNLLFSIVLYPSQIPINQQFIISQLVSLAIKKTLDNYIENVTIKWPNDIYWNNKKLGGILIENSLQGSNIKYSIIGIGLNINQLSFSSKLPNPISMKQITGKIYKRPVILNEIKENIIYFYKNTSFNDIRKQYHRSLYRNNGFHLYETETGQKFSAKIVNVDDDGKLLLISREKKTSEFYFKEVQFCI